jgi:hypothetical protein
MSARAQVIATDKTLSVFVLTRDGRGGFMTESGMRRAWRLQPEEADAVLAEVQTSYPEAQLVPLIVDE